MPSIEDVSIRRILDSRGNATVEVDIRAGPAKGRAAAASGASTGKYEPPAFPRGGVPAAIREFRTTVAPRLRGLEVEDQVGLDSALHSIDGTDNFSRIGGNVATAVSIAAAKTAAAASGLPLFRWVAGKSRVALPLPFGNVIGGGRHAIGGTTIQEYLVVSQSGKAVDNVFANASVHAGIRDALAKKFPNDPLGRGDEGAWIAKLKDEEALALVADACMAKSRDLGFPVSPALDLAASEFFREGRYHYGDRSLTREGQIDSVKGSNRARPTLSLLSRTKLARSPIRAPRSSWPGSPATRPSCRTEAARRRTTRSPISPSDGLASGSKPGPSAESGPRS